MIEGNSPRWTRTRDGHTVHADADEHVRLVVRTLGIDESTWAAALDRYAESVDTDGDLAHRLEVLASAFRAASTVAPPLPAMPASACPACSASAVKPAVARSSAAERPAMVYGRCAACGHGHLLAGASPTTIYESDAYYQTRAADGAGYDAYPAEREYRESKGATLLAWLESVCRLPPGPSLLEVGSGFGFTRRAAELRGFRTGGVDMNPFAARAAKELYGFETVTGTLGSALDTGAVAKRAWDVVLYQFVLEHVPDPALELRRAVEAVRPEGYVVFVSPNMAAFELEIFGGAYRSLRADHLHLFSVSSARVYLQSAELVEVAHRTTCNLHLLRGFVEPRELDELYENDRGPDLFVVARSIR
jgi:2-polyprenyl-3-methyl-5-hydroxy-6-metoxy-1,4-benzoquinol methylase